MTMLLLNLWSFPSSHWVWLLRAFGTAVHVLYWHVFFILLPGHPTYLVFLLIFLTLKNFFFCSLLFPWPLNIRTLHCPFPEIFFSPTKLTSLVILFNLINIFVCYHLPTLYSSSALTLKFKVIYPIVYPKLPLGFLKNTVS